MQSFVLVHGTGHGGWCWQRLAPILRSSDAEVYAPTLTGVGDRAHVLGAATTLSTHIEDVRQLLFYQDLSDVILVGHSYAGMVISGVVATAPERLRHVIYLDAYLPDEGQTEADLWPDEMREEIESELQEGGEFRAPPSPELMGIADPALADWVRERITPHPMRTYTEPVPQATEGSMAVSRSYISCIEGPLADVFAPFADKARAAGWIVSELSAGHDVMLTHPEELASLLLEQSTMAAT